MNNDALNAILIRFSSPHAALTRIADFCDDPDAFADTPLGDDLERFLGADLWVIDTTRAAELITAAAPGLGADFCAMTELCPTHFCDPENCADQH